MLCEILTNKTFQIIFVIITFCLVAFRIIHKSCFFYFMHRFTTLSESTWIWLFKHIWLVLHTVSIFGSIVDWSSERRLGIICLWPMLLLLIRIVLLHLWTATWSCCLAAFRLNIRNSLLTFSIEIHFTYWNTLLNTKSCICFINCRLFPITEFTVGPTVQITEPIVKLIKLLCLLTIWLGQLLLF